MRITKSKILGWIDEAIIFLIGFFGGFFFSSKLQSEQSLILFLAMVLSISFVLHLKWEK